MSDSAVLSVSPLVTVALSVLNGGSLLELSVRSVLNQTWTNWELLILDDGSTDGAVERLNLLSDPRIIIVRDGQNRGLSARLNQAVAMARGRYFARMDHDDLNHPERFSRQIAFLESHPDVDLLATRCITMDEQGRLNGTLPAAIEHGQICHHPWQGFYMPHPTWMGRIEWFQRNPYPIPAPYCCEDQELLLRAHLTSRYRALPEYLLAYRVRTHTPWRKLWRTRGAMLRMQCRYFLARGQWASIVLSSAIALARISRDGGRELRHRLFPPSKASWGAMPPFEEYRHWEQQIEAINATVVPSDSCEHRNAL